MYLLRIIILAIVIIIIIIARSLNTHSLPKIISIILIDMGCHLASFLFFLFPPEYVNNNNFIMCSMSVVA